MNLLVVILILFLVFGGIGGGYYGFSNYGNAVLLFGGRRF